MKKTVSKILTMAVLLSAPVSLTPAAGKPVAAEAAVGASTRRAVKKYYVVSDVINVRSGPGTDYSVIGTLTRGLEVKVFSVSGEKGNRWARIRFQGVTAYVSVEFLAKKK